MRWSLQIGMTDLLRSTRLVLHDVALLSAVVVLLVGLLVTVFMRAQSALEPDYPSVDHLIVDTQLERLREKEPADLVLLGDSSCLMGIAAPLVAEQLNLEVENYCTIGYVGPAGYASMLNDIKPGSRHPHWIVVALNPAQFVRQPSWESWVGYVASASQRRIRHPPTVKDAFGFGRRSVNRLLAYEPLPGRFALYYGGTASVQAELRNSRGSMLDPGYGLRFASLQALKASADRPNLGSIAELTPNQAFLDALRVLQLSVTRFGRRDVFLLITPVPEGVLDSRGVAELNAARKAIGHTLGLTPENVLDMPLQLPAAYFSSQTHLNQWGRIRYTEYLAEVLQARISRVTTGDESVSGGNSASRDRPNR